MNLYKVTRTDSISYDQFDSMVVAAKDEQAAIEMHPYTERGDYMDEADYQKWKAETEDSDDYYCGNGAWVKFRDINTLKVELIGVAGPVKKGVIIASFNAG